ncbi:MAG: amidohydrolase, partial [Eubacteriales bacterium]|nr:amidohydrolase [Eubacteriales bacterium]
SSTGPTIGLLCEYDALPGLWDETNIQNGHGCGHNLFAAGAIGTAAILREFIDAENIPATIKIFGTPSEEEYGSKPYFAKQGFFDGVDFFMGFHPLEFNGILYSQHNACTMRDYKFYGKSAHAAAEPELGVSALDAVEVMNVSANYLREHVTSDVRIHYIITNGGSRANIVPAFASSRYGIRAQELDNLKKVTNQIDTIARGIAMAFGCSVEIDEIETYANTILNRPLAELAYANMQYIGPPRFTAEEQYEVKALGLECGLSEDLEPLREHPGVYAASTDEGDVSWQGPWIRICMSCLAKNTPGHSFYVTKQANMASAYRGMLQTVKVCVATIVDLLTNPSAIEKTKIAYRENMQDRLYDRSKNTNPDPSIFPDMVGAEVIKPNIIRIHGEEAIILPKSESSILYAYINGEKVGNCVIGPTSDKADIVLNNDLKSGDVVILKYYDSKTQQEILLGYIQHGI